MIVLDSLPFPWLGGLLFFYSLLTTLLTIAFIAFRMSVVCFGLLMSFTIPHNIIIEILMSTGLLGIILILINLTYSCEKKTVSEEVVLNSEENTNSFGIMPVPAKIEWGEGICRIDHSFDLSLNVPEGSRSEEAVQRG